MKISHIKISGWRILQDFEVSISTQTPVFIGENGSGKSTLLEAIARIFAYFYQVLVYRKKKEDPLPAYSLEYEIEKDGKPLNVLMEHEKDTHIIAFEGKVIQFNEFAGIDTNTALKILPSEIVIYYAGITKRMESIAHSFYEQYRKDVLQNADAYSLKDLILPANIPFTYCDPLHLSISFLALLANGQGHVVKKLKVRSYDVLCTITLQQPSWSDDKNPNNLWGAGHGLIRDFLSEIIKYGDSETISVGGKGERYDIIVHLDANKLDDLQKALNVNHFGQFMYRLLDFLYFNGFLKSIDIEWGEGIHLGYLSEGEKQLILTSGLAELWQYDQCLFLFDEPDTFLHPRWQSELIPEVKPLLGNSQMIMTSHSAVMLSSLEDNEVFNMENGDAKAFALKTYGMGVNDILDIAMSAPSVTPKIRKSIDHINQLILDQNFDRAKEEITRLKAVTGENPDIVGLESLIEALS